MYFLSKPLGLHVELVRGCTNTKCPSHYTVCREFDVKFMSEDNFQLLLSRIDTLEVDSLFMYGLGDTLLHPDIVNMIKRLGKYELRASVDINVVQSNMELLSNLEVDIISLTHKNCVKFIPYNFLNNRARKLKHVFIVNEVTDDLLFKIDDYIDDTINLYPSEINHNFRITKLRTGKFFNDYNIQASLLPNTSNVTICEEEKTELKDVNRALVSYDLKWRRCLYASKEYDLFDDFVNDYTDQTCISCNVPKHDMYEIEIQ